MLAAELASPGHSIRIEDLRQPVVEEQLSVSAAEELLRVPLELRLELVDQAVRERWTPAQARHARLDARAKCFASKHPQSDRAAHLEERFGAMTTDLQTIDPVHPFSRSSPHAKRMLAPPSHLRHTSLVASVKARYTGSGLFGNQDHVHVLLTVCTFVCILPNRAAGRECSTGTMAICRMSCNTGYCLLKPSKRSTILTHSPQLRTTSPANSVSDWSARRTMAVCCRWSTPGAAIADVWSRRFPLGRASSADTKSGGRKFL